MSESYDELMLKYEVLESRYISLLQQRATWWDNVSTDKAQLESKLNRVLSVIARIHPTTLTSEENPWTVLKEIEGILTEE